MLSKCVMWLIIQLFRWNTHTTNCTTQTKCLSERW